MTAGTPLRPRPPRTPGAVIGSGLVTVAVLVAGFALVACSGSDADPAQERQARVEERLRSSFSGTQARCIVERSDPAVIRALDRTVDLEPDSELMTAYSDAVATCVTDPAGPNTDPGQPGTTSTDPPG